MKTRTVLIVASVLAFAAVHASAGPEETFDYFRNNWNVVGLKDYRHGSRLTPNNELVLSGRTPVQVRVGRQPAPLGRIHGKQAMDGWLPVMLVRSADGPVRYTITFWATPLPDAKDWQKAFDWPTEGENYLNWISVKATNTSDKPAEAKAEVQPNPLLPVSGEVEGQAEAKAKNRHARQYSWSWKLGPGESAEGIARYTFFPIDDPTRYDRADASLWLNRTRDYWRGMMDRIAHIEVPCRKATDTLLAAHVCQLIANDHGEVHGGEGFYDTFYIRDGAYQVMELEEAGLWDAARKSVALYLPRQRPDGRFESQAGQFDANGQAVWVLWQYYLMTHDRKWLEDVYPRMKRATEWTMKARRQAPADSAFAGLLPAAVADGECLWEGKHHIVGYDLWNLRGIHCTVDAAKALDKTQDAEDLAAEAKLYREAIDAAWKRTGEAHFPPTWEKAGTHWGNTETLWPTEIFARDDARVTALSRHVRENFAGGFIEGTIQWKGTGNVEAIHPYMGAYTTMVDLARGKHEQVIEDFYWYLLHSTAAHAFPEGIYYKKREAWNNTIPHVTGACNYAIMLRHMLVHEAGDELHLLSAVPDWWLEEGREIRVKRAPTHFGEMGLFVRGGARGVEVRLEPPKRNPPRRIVLHLPQSRPLVTPLENVSVALRAEQKRRWDFPTIVSLYEKSGPPELHPKPDAVSLTTGKPATCSSALPAHPAALANDGWADKTELYWATDVESQNDPKPWWKVDLERPTRVGRVVVVGFYGDQRHYEFTLEGSRDGNAWDLLADQRDNAKPATRAGYECKFPTREVRYLRVTMVGNSANTGRHLVEVMAFEK